MQVLTSTSARMRRQIVGREQRSSLHASASVTTSLGMCASDFIAPPTPTAPPTHPSRARDPRAATLQAHAPPY